MIAYIEGIFIVIVVILGLLLFLAPDLFGYVIYGLFKGGEHLIKLGKYDSLEQWRRAQYYVALYRGLLMLLMILLAIYLFTKGTGLLSLVSLGPAGILLFMAIHALLDTTDKRGLRKAARKIVSLHPDRCPNCAYSIKGLNSDTCPECGWEFPDFMLEVPKPPLRCSNENDNKTMRDIIDAEKRNGPSDNRINT